MALSAGKQKRLKALSNGAGIIAALAMDQRDALRKLFAKAAGRPVEDVPAEWLIEFKEHVSRILSPHASAILLDPEYGIPAAAARHAPTGLLLACEQTGYDRSVRGRLPRVLGEFPPERLKTLGADAIKALLYYFPDSEKEINARKQEWVEGVGGECRALDLPFFLELVCYHDELDEKGTEFAKLKPDLVTRSLEEFCQPKYVVDVIKVGVPVNMRFVESASVPRERALYSRAQARELFQRASQAATLPFIYLSEGVSNEMFADALTLAAEAGSEFSGVLCGRAIWQDGVAVFAQRGSAALQDWLGEYGVWNVKNVVQQLAAARPCFEKHSAAFLAEQ